MLDYNKIDLLIKNNYGSGGKLAEYCGMTSTGFRESLKKKRLTVDNLEKIAAFFSVDIADLFTEDQTKNGKLKRKIYLEDRVTELENQVKLLNDKNDTDNRG